MRPDANAAPLSDRMTAGSPNTGYHLTSIWNAAFIVSMLFTGTYIAIREAMHMRVRIAVISVL